MEGRMILGIDFNNLIYASFYKPPVKGNVIPNVAAIRDFFFKLRTLKETLRPEKIVISRDINRASTIRRQLYPQYKAHRGSMPDELKQQIPYALDILKALGYPIFGNESYESDDILGMLSRYTNQHGYYFVIASSDKDFFQLINEKTMVFNMTEQRLYCTSEVEERYSGLTPTQLIDLKSIMGDTSDNIPGVYGIGEVYGVDLVNKFKSLDGIYENINFIKSPLRDKLIKDKQNAYLSLMLGKIVTDHSLLGLTLDQLERKPPDMKTVFEIINSLGLSESLNMIMRYTFTT